MIPPVFPLLQESPAASALLGQNPLRVFPFDEAPEGVEYPYVTYTVFSGDPQNTMDKTPLIDKLSTQIDVWGNNHNSTLDVGAAIRDALEPYAHMVGLGSMIRDPETKSYRLRLDFDFFTER